MRLKAHVFIYYYIILSYLAQAFAWNPVDETHHFNTFFHCVLWIYILQSHWRPRLDLHIIYALKIKKQMFVLIPYLHVSRVSHKEILFGLRCSVYSNLWNLISAPYFANVFEFLSGFTLILIFKNVNDEVLKKYSWI